MLKQPVHSNQKGFSTLEILVAFLVLSLTVGAIISLVFGGQSVAVDSQTYSEAAYKGQAMLEDARATAKQNFDSVTKVLPYSDGIYQKSLDVKSIDFVTKKVTSAISWSAEGGRNPNVQFTTILTNPIQAAGADTCNPVLTGDWTKPQAWKDGYGYADIVSPTGATGLDVLKKKVYLTSDPSDPSKDDFYVFDASNPKPVGLHLPLLGSFSTTYGLTDVRVAGQYAYVAAHSAKYQLLVIDISDPAGLNASKIVGKLDVTAPGDTAYGNTLFYLNKKIYLGLTKSDGVEFHIIDVSDPKFPKEIGPGFETDTAINQILVKDNFAYLATPSINQVWVIDISDPLNPTQTDPVKQTFSNPPKWANWAGQSLVLSGSTLYFGRIGGGAKISADLFVLDATDLSKPPAGSLTQKTGAGVSRMVLRGGLIFMSNSDPNDGFQIWDVSNPASIQRYDTTPVNIQQTSTTGMDCEGNFIFIGQKSNRALQIIGPP